MNIKDFKNYLNDIILKKGYDYYIDNNIINVFNSKDDRAIYKLKGNKNFQIKVKLDKNQNIIYSNCNCGYDFDSICKHQVASFYKIQDILKYNEPNLEDILNNLPKKKLIELVLGVAKKDSLIKNSIIFKYEKCRDIDKIKKCEKYIDSIINNYTKDDCIDPMEMSYLEDDLREVLCDIENMYIVKKKPLIFLESMFLLIQKCIYILRYIDSDNKYIDKIILEGIKSISGMIEESYKFNIATREKLFYKLLKESSALFSYDLGEYSINLFILCINFIDIYKLKNDFKEEIKKLVKEGQLVEEKVNSNEKLNLILYEIINSEKDENEIENFIKDNIYFKSFRELFITKFLNDKNYNRIIKLALIGEMEDKENQKLVLKWKELRYGAYKALYFKYEQSILAKEFLINGKMEYYYELKNLYENNFDMFYKDLKNELLLNNKDIYIKIITQEKDLDAILDLVRKKPIYIETYASMLVNKYENEALDIYEKQIKYKCNISSSRCDYIEICRMIVRYKNIAKGNRLDKIINEIKSLYKTKRSLLNELNKCKL